MRIPDCVIRATAHACWNKLTLCNLFDAISNVGIVSFSSDKCCLIYFFLQLLIFVIVVADLPFYIVVALPEVRESWDSDARQVSVCVLAKPPVICSLILPVCAAAIYMSAACK